MGSAPPKTRKLRRHCLEGGGRGFARVDQTLEGGRGGTLAYPRPLGRYPR